MAYHNLDKANYPDLHPTAPVRYVEMQAPTQAPLVAVPAQPVYYQPEDAAYAEIPYATPDAVYAETVETAPPVALPVSNADLVPGVFVPPPLTRQEFEASLGRQVDFQSRKYFREARVFLKPNFCKLMAITLFWGVFFMAVGCGIHRINGGNGLYHSKSNYHYNAPSDFSDSYSYRYEESGFDQSAYYSQNLESRAVLQVALATLLSIFFGVPAMAGMFAAIFNAMRKNELIRFKDFFSCFSCRYYCSLIPLSVTLKVVTGLLSVFVIPAIWFAFITIFAVPLHREHKFLGTCGSISASVKVVHRYTCKMLFFVILNAAWQVVGFFMFGIGLLFTIPLSFVAFCYCYNDLIGVNKMPQLMVQPQVA